MRLLLDTHAFMWWDSAPDKIPEETFTLLKQPQNALLLSLASVWEMQIKVQLGKLTLRNDLKDIVQQQQTTNGIELLPVSLAHVLDY